MPIYRSLGMAPVNPRGEDCAVWPFCPDWSQPVTERWSWKTDVLTSLNGIEQRRALRLYARREHEYEIFEHSSDRSALETLVWSRPGWPFYFPVWWGAMELADPVSVDATVLQLASFRGYESPRMEVFLSPWVAIWNNSGWFECTQVDAVDRNLQRLTVAPLYRAWPKGSWVLPLVWGYLSDELELRTVHPALAKGQFRADIVAQPHEFTQAPVAFSQYRGEYVFDTDRCTWNEPSKTTISALFDQVDNEIAIPERFMRRRTGPTTRSMTVWTNRMDQIADIKQFFNYHRGRWKSFWAPSGCADLLVTRSSGARNLLIVKRIDYTEKVFRIAATAHGRKDVRVDMGANGITYARIVEASNISEHEELLRLNVNLPVVADNTNVNMVSFMSPSRLDSDTAEVVMRDPRTATVSLTMRGLISDL